MFQGGHGRCGRYVVDMWSCFWLRKLIVVMGVVTESVVIFGITQKNNIAQFETILMKNLE